MSSIHFIGQCFHWSTRYSRWLTPFADLAIRLYLAKIFFESALFKIQNWPETLALFHGEYAVPFIRSDIAAVLGTTVELTLPVCIALGLGARIPAIFLFVFNAIAAYSHPTLWTEAGACALKDHMYWGMLLGVLWFHGPGKLSLDYMLVRDET